MTASSPNRKSLKGNISEIEEQFELTEKDIDYINKNGLIKLTPPLITKLNKAIKTYMNMRSRYEDAPLRKHEYAYLKDFANSTASMLEALDRDQEKKDAYDKAKARINRHLREMAQPSYDFERGDLIRQEEFQRGEQLASDKLKALLKLMEKRGKSLDPVVCLEDLRFELSFVHAALEKSMNDFEAENKKLEDTGADAARNDLFVVLKNVYQKALKQSNRKSGQWDGFVMAVHKVMPEDKRFALPKDFKSLYKTKYRAKK